MAAQRTSFEKLQRDRAKKAKQALKREKRQSGETTQRDEDEPVIVSDGAGELSAAELLQQIELIHKQLDDKTISFEEFEELKTDLMARLPID
jgi:predicted RNA-binding protein with PIN domain